MRRLYPAILAALALAMFALGGLSFWAGQVRGCGLHEVQSDYETSLALKLCAHLNGAEAQSWLGVQYIGGGDSDDISQLRLFDIGPPPDPEAAARYWWLRAASRPAGAVAQNEIGYGHWVGASGFAPNRELALKWLERADANGDRIAPHTIAEILLTASPADIDLDLAETYLSRSVARGYEPAICHWRKWQAQRDAIAPDERASRLRELLDDTQYWNCPGPLDQLFWEAEGVVQQARWARERREYELDLLVASIPAEARSCDVYTSLLNELPHRHVRPTTRGDMIADRPGLPDTFLPMEAGAGEDPLIAQNGITVERDGGVSSLRLDISNFSPAPDQPLDIRPCLPGLDIEFVLGRLPAHDRTAGEPCEEDDDCRFYPTGIASFDAVHFSEGGALAIVYFDLECGDLCGHGEFLLMARAGNGTWKMLGRHLAWIS